mgnify:CR=1 FL=1|jgi:hypothetical protein
MAKRKEYKLTAKQRKEFKRICEKWLKFTFEECHDKYHKEFEKILNECLREITETDWLTRVHEDNKDYFIREAAEVLGMPELLGQTPSRKQLREAVKKRNIEKTKDPKDLSLFLLRRFICTQYNRVYNSRFSFNYSGDFLYVMDLQGEFEHRFFLFETKSLHDKKSLFTAFKHLFDFQKAFQEDMNFDKGYFQTERFKDVMDPPWAHRGRSHVAEMNLSEGGFVNHGTYKVYDCVPALVCRNEFVVTAEAIRGLGKGSYRRGAHFMYMLMSHFEEEAKQYPYEY